MTGVRYVRNVHFQVLGPVQVTADGKELPLGGPQQRLVLALLIVARGRTVSTDTLIEGVWGENLPPTARKALQGYVHHLRSEIGEPLATRTGGYSLDTGGAVDAVEFEGLRRRAADLRGSDPRASAELLRQALEIWNGPAYADLSDQHALLPEVARLENLRLTAVGDRIEADLALGRHESLIGELEGLTLEHPFQERFRAQHMTALYRAGRQTEALRAYERLRRFLADESGLEPSEQLKELEERILNQDPALTLDTEVDATSDPAAIRGYELREKVSWDEVSETYRAYQRSVGRQVAVRIIGPRVANDPTFISNFLADTQRVASVDHPHISYVFDTWREPGKAYQVSRWLGGGTLAEAQRSGLRPSLAILGNIGDALAQAHRHAVAHGSVDASHVLFDDAGHAYLSGFQVGYPQKESDLARDRLDFAGLAHGVIGGRSPRRVDGRLVPDLDDPALAKVFEVAFSDEGYGRVEDFVRALRQAAGADVVASTSESPARTEVRNPYKGLKAFQEADAGDFYGREEVIDRLAEVLERRRLITIVGPSGSGKSSLVKAGLLPRLRTGSHLSLLTEMYPGAFPFEELEGALLRVGVDRRSLIDDLVSDDRGLLRILKQILPSDEAELVLVIDQFEELFSTVEDEGTRKLFMDSLVTAVSEPHSRLRVVLTLRADFFDRPLQHARFGEMVDAGLIPVKVPDDEHLAQATVMPARSEGVEFEDGLVSQIVSDVAGQPGGLPLLQYALTELFETRDTNRLTLAAYQRSGGVHGALGRRAEEIHEGLSPPEKASIREAFLRMVTVDENADDLRRRVRRSDLTGIGDQRNLDNALQAYAAARLVTFDRDPMTRGPTVEVAHEALLREWPRLRDWIEEQRDDLVIRRRLDAALEEWKQSGEEDGYLPTGSRLAQFEEWSGETELMLSGEERTFLQAGVEREATRKAHAGRRRRWIMTGFGIAAAVTSVLGLLAFRNAETARAEALAAAAIEQIDEDPERSVLLALQSLETAETPNGLTALHQALQSHRTVWAIPGSCPECFEGTAFAILHPDGEHVVTMDSFGVVEYWETTDGSGPPMWTTGISEGQPISFSRGWFDAQEDTVTIPISDLDTVDGPVGSHRGLYTLDVDTGEVIESLPIEGCVRGQFFPPGDTTVTDPALAMQVFPLRADDTSRCDLEAHPTLEVRHDAFAPGSVAMEVPEEAWAGDGAWWDLSPDGGAMSFSSTLGSHVFDTATGEELHSFDEGWRMTLSRDAGSVILYGDESTTIRDIETTDLLNRIPGSFHWMRFTPDARTLVGASFEQGVGVFEADTGKPVYELVGPESQTIGVRFGGNSNRLLTSGSYGHRLWTLDPNLRELSSIPSVVVSQPSRWPAINSATLGQELIFVPASDGYAIYDRASGELIRQQDSGLGFSSADGSRVVEVLPLEMPYESASGSPALLSDRPRVVDAISGDLISYLPGTCSVIVPFETRGFESGPDCSSEDLPLVPVDVEFSADGSIVAMETPDGKPTVFDLETDSVIWSADVGRTSDDPAVSTAVLSSDGETFAYMAPAPPGSSARYVMNKIDLATGELTESLDLCHATTEAKFSEDGAHLYTADLCSDLAVIDVEDWTEIARFGRGQGEALVDVDVSGRIAATIGSDDVVRAWDVETGEVVLDVAMVASIDNVEFIDDDHIMVLTNEGEVLVFTLDPVELQSIALDRLTRGLTDEECTIYGIDPCPTLEEMRESASS
jgi:DNA-binding SARP family transcriptional activator/WD40 repeat protein/energy-coupling factor transporter ATP-binding protein EcfA2